MEILYATRVFLWCLFASNPIVVLIGRMSTRWNAALTLGKEIANGGALPHGDKVLTREEDANMEHALVNPPPFDG